MSEAIPLSVKQKLNEEKKRIAKERDKKLDDKRSLNLLRQFSRRRKTSQADLLIVIKKLELHCREDETYEDMKSITKEMREILDMVRDKKLEEGRSLDFFLCDLVDVADQALDHSKQHKSNRMYYESIHSWIGEIKKHMLKLGDDNESSKISSENVDDEEDDNYVVGLDEDVKMLFRKRIIGGEEDQQTILIKGMSGIGKTTLAREIFNHPTVVDQFERRAWVSNSTYFTHKELLIKLLQQLEDPENHLFYLMCSEYFGNRDLRYRLHNILQGTRYFIALDDVPKQMQLTSFLKELPQENNRSRLLLTSHITHVDIKEFVDDENVHKMKPLDSKASWQLFSKTINHGNKLTDKHKFPVNLEDMAKDMLRKCGGLPLAIKEVGKQLLKKKVSGESEWEQLLESVNFDSTLKLLEPFYRKLDPKLKSCFMCMSFFKENTTLRAEKLKRIWVLGGAVRDSDCEPYLYGLVNESVIDVKEKNTNYCMNVVLRMLSIRKAEEKLDFEIIRNNGNNRRSQSPRHRVIVCSRDKFDCSTDQDKNLVSLFFHGGGYLDTDPSYWKSFELLKILDLDDFGLKNLPAETIGTLMELGYLGLRNNYIKELPQWLGCLNKLEVLDIAQNFMVEVPDIIWESHSLCHLYMSDVICQKPLNVGALQNLKTLTYISVDDWTCELCGLRELIYLEKLGIEGLDGNSDVSNLFESLAELKKLKHLILRGYRFRSMPCLDKLGNLQRLKTLKLDGLLARLPNKLPPKIESLTLVNSCLDEDPMPLLGEKLLHWSNFGLKYLKLRNAYTGQPMVILSNTFRHLEVLCIQELWNLRNVQCGNYAMHQLRKLEIHDCPNLDTLPEAITSMKSVKQIKMVTTKIIAANIRRNSDLISKIRILDIINP